MILSIPPVESLKGKISLPASKSYSIRAFMIAACGGSSVIHRPSNCDDALVALNTAKALGAQIKWVNNKTIRIQASHQSLSISRINVKESGTVLRFLLPLISLFTEKSVIEGEGTLRSRPNFYLTQALRRLGIAIKGKGPLETVPIVKENGSLRGGTVEIDGSLSSQFVSAFLIACPRLPQNSLIKILGKKMVSQTYVTMTRQILKESGITVSQKSPREFQIKGNQTFRGFKNFTVPSDYGLAAYFLAAGALMPSDLTLEGFFTKKFIQSDGQILNFLKRMGARLKLGEKSIRMQGPFKLKGGNFSLKDCPDLVPVMAILALFTQGKTRLYDIGHAKVKESDRISDLKDELLKVDARVVERSDELTIYPAQGYKQNCILDPHHDHRLAMAFSVLGLKLGIRVKDIECTRKSYPDFVQDLGALGVKIKLSKG